MWHQSQYWTHPATVRHWSSAAMRVGWLVGMRCFRANISLLPSRNWASPRYTELKVPDAQIHESQIHHPFHSNKSNEVNEWHARFEHSKKNSEVVGKLMQCMYLLQFCLWCGRPWPAVGQLYRETQCLTPHPLEENRKKAVMDAQMFSLIQIIPIVGSNKRLQ